MARVTAESDCRLHREVQLPRHRRSFRSLQNPFRHERQRRRRERLFDWRVFLQGAGLGERGPLLPPPAAADRDYFFSKSPSRWLFIISGTLSPLIFSSLAASPFTVRLKLNWKPTG